MLTVNEVKVQLPMVKIKWGNHHYWGKVTGRLNKFATVSPFEIIDHKKRVTVIYNAPCFEFSWITVTDAINYGRELIA
jgi:hypothetical protein